MTITFQPAKRERVHLLVGLAGASGSGKTYSALRLARGLAGDAPFAYIDSESRRALHYADEHQPWEHAELNPPFKPQAYLDAIKAAEGAGHSVIVVDSLTHEFNGPGGLEDWKEAELDRLAGNDAYKREKLAALAWAKPKQAHRAFVDELLRVQAHLILCFRARQAIEFAKDEQGKTVIRPTEALGSFEGWIVETEQKRRPIHFELTCSFLMLPDNPGIPRPIKLPEPLKPFVPLDKKLTEKAGEDLAKWAIGSPSRAIPKAQREELTMELLGLAERLGRLGAVSEAVEKHRQENRVAIHGQWLERQVANASAAVAAMGNGDSANGNDPGAEAPLFEEGAAA